MSLPVKHALITAAGADERTSASGTAAAGRWCRIVKVEPRVPLAVRASKTSACS
jgi:hypothetical protein